MQEPLGGFPPEVFHHRRESVRAELDDGVLVLPASPVRFRSRDAEQRYRPDSELFYLTGLTEPEVVAVLSPVDEGLVLFVRERNPEAELWSGPRLGTEAVRELSGADVVHPIEELESRLPRLLSGPRTIFYRAGIDPRIDRIVLGALARGRATGARKGTGPRALVDPGEVLDDLRLIKDEEELTRIRRATALSVQGFRAALAQAVPGVGEWEVEAVLDSAFRRAGGDGPGYTSIVASGENACVLHYVDNDHRVGAGDLILIDAGAAYRLYHADVTRTFPAGGRFSAEQRAVYEIVEAARSAAVAATRPGATIATVHEAAVGIVVAGLLDLGVLEGDPAELVAEEAYKRNFPHHTSHWLGLDVHDVGDYSTNGNARVLEPGMILTVEPGLYFGATTADGVAATERWAGIGVRVEDDVLVTEDGCENLTAALPTDPDDIADLVGRER